MPPRGYKTKPTELKILEGNPGKRPLPKIVPIPAAAITCPDFLNSAGRREWKRIVPQLQILGLLTGLDRAGLAAYCDNYGIYVENRKKSKTKGMLYADGKGQIRINPYLTIANRALEQVYRWCTEFGMTPSSRARMVIHGKGDDSDPMERLLDNRQN